MKDTHKHFANIAVFTIIVFGFMIWAFIKPSEEISRTERRHLAQLPKFSFTEVVSGKSSFMSDFDTYAADQFPARDSFRNIHTFVSYNLMGRKEVNDFYKSQNYIGKLEYGIHQDSIDWSLNRMNYINDRYLANSNVYFAIIPDKGYYLTKDSIYPHVDYDLFMKKMQDGIAFADIIDLRDELNAEDYYLTDTHWKQEEILKVARHLSMAMGNEFDYEFTSEVVKNDFAGVYYGQSAINVPKDSITLLKADYMKDLVVTCYDTGKAEIVDIYDMEALNGMDPYEVYLTGSKALITIENPNAATDKELVIFRDSFGSSIAPLMAGNYKKITLVDIRYINPGLLDRFVDFEGCDVLFLYSEMILNNSVGQFVK